MNGQIWLKSYVKIILTFGIRCGNRVLATARNHAVEVEVRVDRHQSLLKPLSSRAVGESCRRDYARLQVLRVHGITIRDEMRAVDSVGQTQNGEGQPIVERRTEGG